jgi:glycerol-3-phosphate acyltransferase PlsY
LGAIPFGYIFFYITDKKDIRTLGSGNIGATNILRVKGKKWGIITLIVDLLKGIAPVIYARIHFDDPVLILLIGAMAVLGHIFPVYLKFKGGKGVATFLGVVSSFHPLSLVLFLGIFISIIFLTKLMSAANLAATSSVFFLFLFTKTVWVSLISFILLLLIIWKHNQNIQRLLQGKENKIGQS